MMGYIKRKPGRPKNLANRDALILAGRELLLLKGLGVTTLAIAAKAGVAKATFYAYFPDKEAFIESVLLHESNRTITEEQYAASLSDDIQDSLIAFGCRYLRFVNEQQLLGWDRLIASAYDIYPELATRLFAAGPGRGHGRLADLLQASARNGQLNLDDATLAAGDLTGLWHGFAVLEINLRARPGMEPDEIYWRAKRGVDMFMRIYGK